MCECVGFLFVGHSYAKKNARVFSFFLCLFHSIWFVSSIDCSVLFFGLHNIVGSFASFLQKDYKFLVLYVVFN